MTLLIGDPAVADIPVLECGEPLVRLEPGLTAGGRRAVFVRAGIAGRLATVAAALPPGVGLAVVAGHRAASEQLAIVDGYTARLRANDPLLHGASLGRVPQTHALLRDAEARHLRRCRRRRYNSGTGLLLRLASTAPHRRSRRAGITGHALDRLVSRHVAPLATAPHVAGAAVDLTLTVDGEPVWMGSLLDATPEESAGRCYTDAPGLDVAVCQRRRTLAAALGAAGFVNYPTEWWHWSHGDRYWAAVTGAPHALYGPIDLPLAAGVRA